jgi:ClpP class serine protease
MVIIIIIDQSATKKKKSSFLFLKINKEKKKRGVIESKEREKQNMKRKKGKKIHVYMLPSRGSLVEYLFDPSLNLLLLNQSLFLFWIKKPLMYIILSFEKWQI